MGIVTMGPPCELVFLLRDRFALSTFVETGTYRGDTARWAAAHFCKVITVEAAEQYFREASTRQPPLRNVTFVHGDSPTALADILPTLGAPALFWLDSHWCGAASAGRDDQCPLLREIDAITASGFAHHILVDDARLFLAPPPRPNDATQWPDIRAVLAHLTDSRRAPRYVVVIDDVIVAVPDDARDALLQFCQDRTTAQWQQRAAPSILDGVRTIRSAARQTAKRALREIAGRATGRWQ